MRSLDETALAPDEIVTAVHVPIPPAGTRGSYAKFVTRSSEDRPCVGVIALVRMERGTCVDLRVAVGAATETPQRYRDLEAGARGTSLDADVVRQVAAGYAARIDPLDDMRGSAWYRRTVTEVWGRRTVERAAPGAA